MRLSAHEVSLIGVVREGDLDDAPLVLLPGLPLPAFPDDIEHAWQWQVADEFQQHGCL